MLKPAVTPSLTPIRTSSLDLLSFQTVWSAFRISSFVSAATRVSERLPTLKINDLNDSIRFVMNANFFV